VCYGAALPEAIELLCNHYCVFGSNASLDILNNTFAPPEAAWVCYAARQQLLAGVISIFPFNYINNSTAAKCKVQKGECTCFFRPANLKNNLGRKKARQIDTYVALSSFLPCFHVDPAGKQLKNHALGK
jgi:hypothetical protein